MNDIQFDELLKSKDFIKQVKIADSLTKKTGLEHGFSFCKSIHNEILIDKMCVGSDCVIKFDNEICGKIANTFHTHTIIESSTSEFSVSDIYRAAQCSHILNEPYITCVKDISDDYVFCIKIIVDQDNDKMLENLWSLYHEFSENETYETQEIILNEMYKTLNPEIILFNYETGNIIK